MTRATELRVVAYNLESGDADIETLAERVESVQAERLADIWGFSEAELGWRHRLAEACGGFSSWYGTTGGADRLMLCWDPATLELVERPWELHHINPGGRYRSPLVGNFVHRATGEQFLFCVNHLARGRARARHEQSERLNQWASDLHDWAIVTAGDFNYDWEVEGGDAYHDTGYDLLTQDDRFLWVRPSSLIRTQFGSRYNSVLDFVFAGSLAMYWASSSEILVSPGNAPNTRYKSDHRPVYGSFLLGGSELLEEQDPAADANSGQIMGTDPAPWTSRTAPTRVSTAR